MSRDVISLDLARRRELVGARRREAFLDAALECIDTPYHHQGRKLGVGMDCGGPIVHACRRLELPIVDPRGYGPWGNGTSLLANLRLTFVDVELDDEALGDVLVFWFRNPKVPQHLGIASRRGLLHSAANLRKCIDQEWDHRWRERLIHRMRHPELA